MKIAGVTAHPLRCQLETPFAYSQKWFSHRTALLVQVTTQEGVSGWGEIFCHDAWPALAALVEQVYSPLLVGQDALAREVIWEKIYNWSRDYGQKGLTTAARVESILRFGISQARWPGLPISKLMGGSFRDHVQAYATGMYRTEHSMDNPQVVADEAASYVAQGFRAVKIKIGFGIDRDLAAVRSVRQAIGDSVGLMVDANHAYDAASAISVGKALEPFDIAWFEEPGGARRPQRIPHASGAR